MEPTCPNCERFIGSVGECPFCGFDDITPRFMKNLRIAAFCLALFGLAALSIMSFCRDLPLIKAGRITPMMNYAHVRATGTAVNDAYVGKRKGSKGYVSFFLHDDTGDIRVVAYGNTARELVDEKKTPNKNDEINVEGRLRVSGDGKVTLMLNSLECMRKDAVQP